MRIEIDVKQYSKGEEIANSVIHGIGALLGIVGLTVLLVLATINGSITHFVSYLIYGISLIFLYTSSTLYHALPFLKAKTLFKLLDHIGIYLLIAGTYTPFLALHLSEKWSLWMLISIWFFALVGIIFKLFFTGRFKLFSTLMYIAMGWLIVIAYKPMAQSVPAESMKYLFLGGLFYTGGTVAYLMKKVKYHHAVWHTFVFFGSLFHYVAIISSF